MVEIVLFSAAGFLTAALIALFAMPYITRQAARTAVRKVRENMPFSAAEMSAEKDQLRAEHAVALRKLEMQLEKQAAKVSAQNIELNEIREKFEATNKVSKAGKLALEEIRSKEHDLNERLRQRDAEYAGLEQRSRQMLRENRELKTALRKEGKSVRAILEAAINDPTQTTSKEAQDGLPIADKNYAATSKNGDIETELASERAKNNVANKEIAALREQLSIALNAMPEEGKKSPRLPKAKLPTTLDASHEKPSASPQDDEKMAALQEQLLDMAAEMARITATLEGNTSPIHGILAATDKSEEGSLSARMKSLIEKAKKEPAEKEDQTPASKDETKASKKPARRKAPAKPRAKTASLPKASGLPDATPMEETMFKPKPKSPTSGSKTAAES